MKVGIIAALVLALAAIYFVFGSDFLAPSNSEALSSKEKTAVESGDGASPAVHPRPHRAQGAADTDESEADSDRPATRDPELNHEGPQDAPGAPGSNENVHRTPGVTTTHTRHDGVVVRDHRTNAPPIDLDNYTVLPDEVSKVKGGTLMAVQMALRAAVKECTDSHAAGAEVGARMQLSLLTSIAAETLTVDKARVKISGVEAEEQLRSCVEGVAIGHEQAVAGHEDVPLHRMVFKYHL